MTVVGKILVFLNLLFSLVVGAFAVIDYTSRTHWATSYKELENRYKLALAAKDTHQKESTDLAKEKEQLYADLRKFTGLNPKTNEDKRLIGERAVKLLDEQDKLIASLRATIDGGDVGGEPREGLRQQLAKLTTQFREYQANQEKFALDFTRRQADTTKLRTDLKEQATLNLDLTRDRNRMLDEKVQAEIKARGLEDLNKRLLTRLTELDKISKLAGVAMAKGGAGMVGRASARPPEDLKGRVLRAEGRLLEVSLGSDHGLMPNHKLYVFRLGQPPLYLGEVRVRTVEPNSAVVEVEGPMRRPIQKDDRVESSILGGP